jgi:ABC-2 type transport system permease protein
VEKMKTIYILWLRQVKRYWRSKPRLIGSLGQPLLFLVALGFGFGPIFEKAGGGNYIQFLAPGIIAMSILFSSMFNGIEVIWDRQFGFLKETLVAPISRIKIMVGRTLGGATVSTAQGIVVFLLSLIVGFRPSNWAYVPLALVFMFLTALLFTSLGTAIASKLEDMHAFQLIMNFLIMPIFFLSGALFPLQDLPKSITVIAALNPLAYGVDALRFSFNGAGNIFLDFAVVGTTAVVIGLIGSYLFSKIEI